MFLKKKYSTVIKTSETIVKVHKNGIDVKNLTIRGNDLYQIGSIYISVSDINPSNYFGGTWEPFGIGRTLVGVDLTQEEFNKVEKEVAVTTK